ncbi:MAG TPA: hypothetical protein VK492_05770 [Chitinophagaceae bacterium]|nr:hypothetical protein [Chitinophagaceae bacterium]
MKEYKKSLEDEIDWKIIDQLHTATINFSTASLELKKLFFVLVGIAVPALIKLSGDSLDLSMFITLYILTFTFWFLDSFTYFYQEKLREKMDTHFFEIKKRNSEPVIISDKKTEEYTLEDSRSSKDRLWRSASNNSVRFYFILSIINSIGFILFLLKIIR